MEPNQKNLLKRKLINYRRDFHKYAEAKWTEFRTTSIVTTILTDLGYDISLGTDIIHPEECVTRPDETIIEREIDRAISQGADKEIIKKMNGYTGVVGILHTNRPGPTVAYRFDMDALHNKEVKEKGHRPYDEGFVSVNEGYMHACGHDGHTAIGLGVAEELIKIKDQLCGTIKLIFQPAEEGGGGARSMVARGVVDDVDFLFVGHLGLAHNGIPLPSRSIAGGCNDFLDNRRYDVTYHGKAAHPCGDPHKGKNALLAACTAALNIHSIAPHGEGLFRVNVGFLQAGANRNTIAPSAFFQVETRGENDEIAKYGEERVLSIIKSTAKMYDLDFDIEPKGHTPSAKSDKELAKLVLEVASSIEWFNEFYEEGNVGGSDDAADMMRRVQERGGKATYLGWGSNLAASFHNNRFDFDEDTLLPAVELMVGLAKKLCK